MDEKRVVRILNPPRDFLSLRSSKWRTSSTLVARKNSFLFFFSFLSFRSIRNTIARDIRDSKKELHVRSETFASLVRRLYRSVNASSNMILHGFRWTCFCWSRVPSSSRVKSRSRYEYDNYANLTLAFAD